MNKKLSSILIVFLFFIFLGCKPEPSSDFGTDPEEPPTAPNNIIAVITDETTTVIHWTDQSDNEIGFKIWISENTTYSVIPTREVGADVEEASFELDPGDWNVRINAYNDEGESDYCNIEFTVAVAENAAIASILELATIIENETGGFMTIQEVLEWKTFPLYYGATAISIEGEYCQWENVTATEDEFSTPGTIYRTAICMIFENQNINTIDTRASLSLVNPEYGEIYSPLISGSIEGATLWSVSSNTIDITTVTKIANGDLQMKSITIYIGELPFTSWPKWWVMDWIFETI